MSAALPALADAPAPTPLCGDAKADNGKKAAQPDAKGEKTVKGDKKDSEKDPAKSSPGAA